MMATLPPRWQCLIRRPPPRPRRPAPPPPAPTPTPYPADPALYLRDELARVALLVQAYLLGRKPEAPHSGGAPAVLPPECEAVLSEPFRWEPAAPDPDT